MLFRSGKIIGEAVEGVPWLGTFHSISAQILRRHADECTGEVGVLAPPALVRDFKAAQNRAHRGPIAPFKAAPELQRIIIDIDPEMQAFSARNGFALAHREVERTVGPALDCRLNHQAFDAVVVLTDAEVVEHLTVVVDDQPGHLLEVLGFEFHAGLEATAELRPAPCDQRLLEPVGKRQILQRMLRNLKAIYIGSQDNHRALRCTDRIVMLLPEHAPEYREVARLPRD